jgi:hypothetical protein
MGGGGVDTLTLADLKFAYVHSDGPRGPGMSPEPPLRGSPELQKPVDPPSQGKTYQRKYFCFPALTRCRGPSNARSPPVGDARSPPPR